MGHELTPRDGGFSLIELVIVVAVVGILAVTVALSTGRGGLARGASPEARVAQALDTAVAAARDTALLARQTIGLRPLPDGWQVVARDAEGGWAPAGPEGRAPGALWEVAGAPLMPWATGDEGAPAVLFLPDGRATPFVLRLASGRLMCATDGWEPLRCRAE